MRAKYLCGLLCVAASCAHADLLPERLENPVEKYFQLRELLDPLPQEWHVFGPLNVDALGLPELRHVERSPEQLEDMDVTHYIRHYASRHPKVQQLRNTLEKYEQIKFHGGDLTFDISRSLRFLQKGGGNILTLYTNSSKPKKGIFTINLGSLLKRSFRR